MVKYRAFVKNRNFRQKVAFLDAVETHLVRVHGQERKYTCEYCGTQFIHQKHWRRHMNKHQSNPEKIYRTQPVRRGYTKNTSEYWQTKPGNAGQSYKKLTIIYLYFVYFIQIII